VEEECTPLTRDDSTTRSYIVLGDGAPIGYIQSYVAMGSGEGWWPDEQDPGVRGIDQFLAHPGQLGRGIGTAMVRAFVQRLFADPSVTRIQTDPSPQNRRAIRCYEKAGFRVAGEIDTPDGRALLMICDLADARQSPDRLAIGLLFAPLVFVAHFLEESPGFVAWFNDHVTRGITQDMFWTVNFTGLLITVIVCLLVWTTRSVAAVVLAVAWLSCLMLTNGVFHITGAVVDRAYVPGLATAILLYLPYCGWVAREVLRDRRIAPGLLAGAAILGAIPMAVHGYRILFLGTRLF
jgi:GNAT superfamily N-acetyltransferase